MVSGKNLIDADYAAEELEESARLFLLLRLLAPESAPFPTHGLVVLECDEATIAWREVWRVQAATRSVD